MDDLLRAIVLGIVQGLTEFLPVSSSGHLILVPALFKWPDQGLAFDVALHLGTLLALLVYFARDWARMATTGAADAFRHRLDVRSYDDHSRLLLLIALGSIPAAIVGILFDDWIEENVRQAWLVAVMLAGVGAIMFVADRRARLNRRLDSIGPVDAILIGLAQACALIPGVSRSGATITVGLFRGFSRDSAARFAFLLGTPAFLGAGLLKLPDITEASGSEWGELAAGFACATVVGFLSIHYLLRFLRTNTLIPFVVYRFGVAAITLAIAGFRVS